MNEQSWLRSIRRLSVAPFAACAVALAGLTVSPVRAQVRAAPARTPVRPAVPRTPVRPVVPAAPAPAPTTPGSPPVSSPPPAPTAGPLAANAEQLAAWNERSSVRVTGVRKRVLALYYPWYGTPERSGRWLHQDGVDVPHRRIASHVHYPAAGPYDSRDPALIERHLRQAKAAGIDTLVCSWWGRDDPTDAAIRLLCQKAPLQGMEVAVLWERASRRADAAAAAADLAYLQDTFAAQPTYLREGGKPVIFVYAGICGSLKPDQWAGVMAQANRRTKSGVLLVGDVGPQPTLSDLLLWDGLYNLGHTLQEAGRTPEESAQLLHESSRASIFFARQAGRISIETVAPGYDDRQLGQGQRPPGPSGRPGVATGKTAPAPPPGTVVDRQDGRLWVALWEQALRDKPDWVLVNSFNQWHSGTEIEPSAELGDRYLTETGVLAARFRPATQRKAVTGRP